MRQSEKKKLEEERKRIAKQVYKNPHRKKLEEERKRNAKQVLSRYAEMTPSDQS